MDAMVETSPTHSIIFATLKWQLMHKYGHAATNENSKTIIAIMINAISMNLG